MSTIHRRIRGPISEAVACSYNARDLFLLNWEVVGFDHGEVNRMVPLLNPLKGTRRQFEAVFDAARDSRAFIKRLETGFQ